MPDPKKFKDRKSFMTSCVPTVKGEGKSTSQAVAQCSSMWSSRNKKRTEMMTHDPMLELASCILNRPVLFDKAWLDALLAIRSGNADAESFFDSLFSDAPKNQFANRDGVAVIDVRGPLMKDSKFLSSYAAIEIQMGNAIEDPEIRSILLNIDSGGGVVNGAFELSDKIHASRPLKPIHAVANDDALSAAFAIGSAASHLTLSPTGAIGSVGAIATHVEHSKAEAAQGWTYTTVYSGERKNDLSKHEPLSPEALADLQELVDDFRGMFSQRVSRNRRMTFNNVMDTEAANFRGQQALDVGFADSIGSFDAALAAASEAGGSDGSTVAVAASITTTEVSDMGTDTTTTTTSTAPVTTDVAEVIDLESVRSEARDDSRQANKEVIELCALAGQPNLALGFIENGTPVADVRKALLDARADGSEDDEIISTEPENATQHEHDSKALVNTMTRLLTNRGITPEVR